MKNQNRNIIGTGLVMLTLILMWGIAFIGNEGRKNDEIIAEETQKTEHADSLIGQYQLRETYGWKNVILWIESKENFEKAYGDSLRKTGHAMLFKKDIMCTGPFGETGDWECEKMCFNYVVPEDTSNVINEIAKKSRGKTLVVIGSLFNNGSEFGGKTYWCE